MKKIACALSFVLVAACSSDPATTPSTDAGAVVTPDAGDGDHAVDGSVPVDGAEQEDAGPASCTAAGEQLLQPIDTVSTGEVTVLSDSEGSKTIFVDATAGGMAEAAGSPRVYLNLETASRVALTDKTASESTAWDLAIKRPVLFTNSGDGGPGQGGALLLAKEFDAVTAADVTGQTFAPESFFEEDCTPKVDQTGAVKTSFDGWYDYDTSTNGVSPHEGTWIVKGGTGKLFKLEVLSYYATPDGGVGQAGGRYTIKVGAL